MLSCGYAETRAAHVNWTVTASADSMAWPVQRQGLWHEIAARSELEE